MNKFFGYHKVNYESTVLKNKHKTILVTDLCSADSPSKSVTNGIETVCKQLFKKYNFQGLYFFISLNTDKTYDVISTLEQTFQNWHFCDLETVEEALEKVDWCYENIKLNI